MTGTLVGCAKEQQVFHSACYQAKSHFELDRAVRNRIVSYQQLNVNESLLIRRIYGDA